MISMILSITFFLILYKMWMTPSILLTLAIKMLMNYSNILINIRKY